MKTIVFIIGAIILIVHISNSNFLAKEEMHARRIKIDSINNAYLQSFRYEVTDVICADNDGCSISFIFRTPSNNTKHVYMTPHGVRYSNSDKNIYDSKHNHLYVTDSTMIAIFSK